MNRLNPFSAKRLKEIAEGKRNRDGSLRVTAAELQARRGAFAAKVADAIAGGSKAPRRSRTARQKAKDAADKWFSEWIRLRDAGPDGRVKCITCSHTDHWRYLQCGHYVTRGHESTRYDEQNANAQCRGCNYNGGQHLKHAIAIDAKFGEGTSERLEEKGRRECKRNAAHYQFIADTYKERVDLIRRTEPERYETRKAA